MTTVPISEVATINPKAAPAGDPRRLVGFLAMSDVSEDGTVLRVQERTYAEVAKGYTPFSREDILLAKITPCFENGKSALLADFPYAEGFGSTEFHVLRPGPNIEPRYLRHLLRSAEFRRRGASNMTGSAGQKRLSVSFLARYELSLPTRAEQRSIADILDRVDGLRDLKRQRLCEPERLLASTFQSAFGELLSSDAAPTARLGDLADITSGVTKGRNLSPGSATREIPYLAVVNVQERQIDLRTTKTIPATAHEIERYRLKRDDLVLTEGGDPDKLGRAAIWEDQLPEAIHQNHIFRVRLTSGDVLPQYLLWLITSPYGKRYFLRMAKQTTGIATINMQQLRAFPVILADLKSQMRFVQEAIRIRQLQFSLSVSAAEEEHLHYSLEAKLLGSVAASI